MRRYSFFLLILCLLAACGDDARIATVLNRADSLMCSRPDSALTLLDSALHTGDASDRQTARLRLRRLNAINKLDTVFTEAHVAQASELVTHFDRHGTPNERMLAHYLFGRTYADAGQAPQAIQSYLEAAECADTTSVDCDYEQMEIIYTQMANIFYNHCLYREQLNCLDQAMYYGSLANDTLGIILAYTQKMGGYELMLKPDSMLYVCNEVFRMFQQAGYPQLAAAVLAHPVSYLIEKGKTDQAYEHLIAYERKSGYFDNKNNIQSGREIFYYNKGLYFLAICQYDSAEYYFRKELHLAKDYNNQNSGSKGLALLFQRTHRPDSAAKYALYSYAMNDSMHFYGYNREIGRMKAMYDYSRFQRQAIVEKERAEHSRNYLITVTTVAVLFLIIIVLITQSYRRLQNKRKEEERKYFELTAIHMQTKKELADLRNHQSQFHMLIDQKRSTDSKNNIEGSEDSISLSENTLEELIRQKEEEVSRQERELSKYKQREEIVKNAVSAEQRLLFENAFYAQLVKKTDIGKKMTGEEWTKVETFIQTHLPDFYHFMKVRRGSLTNYEYQVALLVRLHIKPKNISGVVAIDGSYVDRVRRSLLKKLFNSEGKAKDADVLIKQIGQFME